MRIVSGALSQGVSGSGVWGSSSGSHWGQKRGQGLHLNLWTPVLLHVGGGPAITSLGRQSRLKAHRWLHSPHCYGSGLS